MTSGDNSSPDPIKKINLLISTTGAHEPVSAGEKKNHFSIINIDIFDMKHQCEMQSKACSD
jgi:hypothetical protein